jgi:hypothetical protein
MQRRQQMRIGLPYIVSRYRIFLKTTATGEIFALLEETRASYIENNASSQRLPQDMSLGYSYKMVRDYTEVTGSASFFVFSAIGFDAAGDQALVYASYGCGDLCGVGKVYLLEREADGWRIQNVALLVQG